MPRSNRWWTPAASRSSARRRSTCFRKRLDRIQLGAGCMGVPRGARPHPADGLRGAQHRIRDRASAPARVAQQEFLPLYASFHDDRGARRTATTPCAASRACCRRGRSRRGRARAYVGEEVFLSLVDPHARAVPRRHPPALGVRAGSPTATCRAAAARWRPAASAAWRLDRRGPVTRVDALRGPTRPVPRRPAASCGWRLVSHLTLNYLSLVGDDAAARRRGAARHAGAVRRRRKTRPGHARSRACSALQAQPVVRRLPFSGPLDLRLRRRDRARARRARPSRAAAPSCSPACWSASSRGMRRSTASRSCAAHAAARRGDALAAAHRARRRRMSHDAPTMRRAPSSAGALAACSRHCMPNPCARLLRTAAAHRVAGARVAALRPGAAARRRSRCGWARSRSSTSRPRALASFAPARPARRAWACASSACSGRMGPLPLHLTEYVRERLRITATRRSRAFSTCSTTACCRCSTAPGHRPSPPCSDRPRRRPLRRLAGRVLRPGRRIAAQTRCRADNAALFQAGLLGRAKPACRGPDQAAVDSTSACRCASSRTCRTGCALEQDDRSRLGHAAADPSARALRRAARRTAHRRGHKVRDRQYKFRIVLGPLTLAQYERLPARRPGWRELRDWVRSYAGPGLALGRAS